MKKVILTAALALCCATTIGAADMTGKKVYINPGHGGYWNGGTIEQEVDASGNVISPRKGNDRFVATIPFPTESEAGFWESKSNLVKGLELKRLLEAAGCEVMMSRTTNTEADDKDLKSIGLEANAYLGAAAAANPANVAFISVHSNALGSNGGINYFLNLYNMDADKLGKNATYMALGQSMATNSASLLMDNEITVWSPTAPKIWEDNQFLGYTLGVLRHLDVPGFLVEGSFHDYQPETHRLLNDDYCKLAAYNMYRYFCEYFGADKPSTGVIAGAVKHDQMIIKEKNYKNWVKGSHDRFYPINGATVTLLDANGNTLKTYTTDNNYNGVYVFWDLTPGAYKVKMEAAGFEAQTIDVTVEASKITDQVTQLHDPNYVAPEPALAIPNVYASGLKATAIADGKYQIDFTLNTAAEDVTIKVYEQDENATVLVKEVSYGAKEKGANSVELNLAGVNGTGLTWAVEATGPSTNTDSPVNFVNYTDPAVQYGAPSDVKVDNNTESEFFGRVYVLNSIGKAADNRTTADGLFVLDATLSDVTGQGEKAYTGNIVWAENSTLTSVASPHRMALDEEGNIFVCDWSDGHSGVWYVAANNLNSEWKPVFGGTRNGDGLASEGGVAIHGSLSAIAVAGKGDERTLYTYDEDYTVNGSASILNSYKIGTLANTWVSAPTTTRVNGTDGINHNAGQKGYLQADGKGGLWVSQYRGGEASTHPALVHYNAAGVPDFTHTIWDGRLNYAFAVNQAGDKFAVNSGTSILLGDITYDENDVPTVTLNEIEVEAEGTNTYGLAFDAADNLYRVASDVQYLQGFAWPKENNSHETKAPSKYTLNGTTGIDDVTTGGVTVKAVGDDLVITSAKAVDTVTVYSMAGAAVYANAGVNAESLTVNMASWSNGVYIVKVDNKVYKIVR